MTRDDRGMELDPQQIPATLKQPAMDAGQPVAPPAADEVTERLMHLRGMLADLDGYIQRRAEDLAEPMIRGAEARCRLAITEARAEVQRKQDVNHELGRRLRALEKRSDENRDAVARLAAALGYRHPAGHTLTALVGEAETALAEVRERYVQ